MTTPDPSAIIGDKRNRALLHLIYRKDEWEELGYEEIRVWTVKASEACGQQSY